jgi:hypothetical protein
MKTTRPLARFTLASLLCAAGAGACEKDWDPYTAYGPGDASAKDAAAPPDDAPPDRGTSTLSDGRIVTRPEFHYYSRDAWSVDLTTLQPLHTLTLIRSDGAVVVTGCSGLATPAELASFESVVTDFATLEALQQKAPCLVDDGGDDITVTYVGLAQLKHSAACDPQLKMVTAAGDAIVRAVCARAADGGVDAAGDGP